MAIISDKFMDSMFYNEENKKKINWLWKFVIFIVAIVDKLLPYYLVTYEFFFLFLLIYSILLW